MSCITEVPRNPRNQHINLTVRGMDGNELIVKINRSTKLKKLMTAYFEWQSVHPVALAFIYKFDGFSLMENQTPEELEMEDGDVVDVLLQQPLFSSKAEAYSVRKKLTKQLEFVNAYISRFEAEERYLAGVQSQSSHGSNQLN